MMQDISLDVRFIGLMLIGENINFEEHRFVNSQKMLGEVPELESLDAIEGVALMYRFPAFAGRVGFIRMISCDFRRRQK